MKSFVLDVKEYKKRLHEDEYALSTFRCGNGVLSKSERRTVEYKAVKYYRLYQISKNTIYEKILGKYIRHFMQKHGMGLCANLNIGKGLVIGHWGRIIISGEAVIGDQVMLTHGVTIGRDIRGNRKGSPIIGNRVAIRANSTVVGKVTIGDDVVIAPNTFVNFDVPSHSVVIGNPAKVISKENASLGHVGELPND